MSLNDVIAVPEVIILGIFGNTNKISEQDLQDNTLTLILQELGRPPDKILLPVEGNSSIYIQDWADTLHIKSQAFRSDWSTNGKIAQILRDDRIFKECTHALVFLSQKSDRLSKFAEKMCQKGKTVFTSSHIQQLTQLELLHCEPLPPVSKPSRKSNIGKGQSLLKFQKTIEC
jgi:hypothetical protein